MRAALRTVGHLAIGFAAASMCAAIVSERRCANASRGEAFAICKLFGADPVLAQFRFDSLHAKRNSTGARSFLLVEGAIVAPVAAAPKMLITLTDGANHKLYSWPFEIPADHRGPSGRYAFASRLDAPPEGARNAIISFAANEVPASEGVRPQ